MLIFGQTTLEKGNNILIYDKKDAYGAKQVANGRLKNSMPSLLF